jgi:hypothetical protein
MGMESEGPNAFRSCLRQTVDDRSTKFPITPFGRKPLARQTLRVLCSARPAVR